MGELQPLVYDLVRYVELLIEFVFLHCRKFDTHSELLEFFDNSANKLREKIADAQMKIESLKGELRLWKKLSLMPENQTHLVISSKGCM